MSSILLRLVFIVSILSLVCLAQDTSRIMTRTLKSNVLNKLKSSINQSFSKLKFDEVEYKDITLSDSIKLTQIKEDGTAIVDVSKSALSDFDQSCQNKYTLSRDFDIKFTSLFVNGDKNASLGFTFHVKNFTASRIISPNDPTLFYYQVQYDKSLENIKSESEDAINNVSKNQEIVLNSIGSSINLVLDNSLSQLITQFVEIPVEFSGLPNDGSVRKNIIAKINEKVDCSGNIIVTKYRASIIENYQIKKTSAYTFDSKNGDNQVFYDSSLLDELIQSKVINNQFQFLVTKDNSSNYTDLTFLIKELRVILPEVLREGYPTDAFYFACTANNGSFEFINDLPSTKLKIGCSIKTNGKIIFNFNITYLLHLYAPLTNFKQISIQVPTVSLLDLDYDLDYKYSVNTDLLAHHAESIMTNYIKKNPANLFNLNISARNYVFVPNSGLLLQYADRYTQEELLVLS